MCVGAGAYSVVVAGKCEVLDPLHAEGGRCVCVQYTLLYFMCT